MLTVPGTQNIIPYELKLNGESVTLIDTPGFDDTYRTDTDILDLLAKWLHATYMDDTLLTGIILLQPINTNRVSGGERKRTRLFEKICGDDAFSRVVIATTMWDEVKDEKAFQRMQERANSNDFWGNMVKQGARVERHDDIPSSARRIVSMVCQESSPLELLIQKELAQNGCALINTTAGKQLDNNLNETCKKLLEEMRELQDDLKTKLQENQRLMKDLGDLQKELGKIRQDRERLAKVRGTNCLNSTFLNADSLIQPWYYRCTIM